MMGQALCRIAPAWLRLAAAGLTAAAFPAAADEPCPGTEDGLDACRAYIEINATDGDIGFHAKLDAEGWRWAKIYSPRGRPLMLTGGLGPLRRQTVTEFFFESEEPPCWFEAGNDDVDWDEDEVVSLRHFLERFPEGEYHFRVKQPRGGMLAGSTIMSHALPGAPRDRFRFCARFVQKLCRFLDPFWAPFLVQKIVKNRWTKLYSKSVRKYAKHGKTWVKHGFCRRLRTKSCENG